MAEARIRDIIDVTPRFTTNDAIRLNNMFRGVETQEMLNVLLRENMLGDVAAVSSFGAESAALLHMIAQAERSTPVLFLVWKHAPIKTTLIRELQDLCDVTYLEFEHVDELRKGIHAFFSTIRRGTSESDTFEEEFS